MRAQPSRGSKMMKMMMMMGMPMDVLPAMYTSDLVLWAVKLRSG